MWLVGVGGIYGCGCKEVYRFPHTTYPYSSCICSFLQQHPYFLFIFKMFFVLVYNHYILLVIGFICQLLQVIIVIIFCIRISHLMNTT